MKAVELRNVTKSYGSRTIFEKMSFSIDEGEMIALVGPSGSGKSTILNIIGLLETYDNGTVSLFEQELPKAESRAAMLMRRNVINYLFQSFALINDMTILQNLMLSMRFVDISKQEKIGKINNILDTVGLLPLKDSIVNTLSGGEQQRTALARAMLKPGKLILADEPTGSLDAHAADLSFFLIQSLCKQYKKTVILVTHNLELAKRADNMIDIKSFQR